MTKENIFITVSGNANKTNFKFENAFKSLSEDDKIERLKHIINCLTEITNELIVAPPIITDLSQKGK